MLRIIRTTTLAALPPAAEVAWRVQPLPLGGV